MGSIEAIHLAEKRKAPMQAVQSAHAIAGQGLFGDRYFGVFRKGAPYPQGAITLIEAEALEAASVELGSPLAPGESRRNVTTRGIRLNDLVGRRFRLGGALIEGYELCHPCIRLQRLAQKPLLKALRSRGGLRAYIVEGGEIAVGDPICLDGERPQ